MTNPLVAPTKDSTTATSGIALLDDARTLSTAIENGDWAAGVLGVAGTAMDALMVVADPFGAIFAAGVGWLMEHVGPLKEALDKLAGNPDAITAHSQTWQNISDELGNIAQDLKNQVTSDLADWQGAGADTYRQKANDLATLLGAAQEATAGTSKGVKTAGEVVAAVRQLVRDTIAQVVGHMVSWALQVVLTLGIGLAWVVPQVATLVGKTATQIAKLVKNLTTAMKALTKLLSKAGGIFDDAAKGLKNVAPGSASKGGKIADLPSGGKNLDPVRGDTTPSNTPDLPKDTPDKVSAPPKLDDTTTPSSSRDLPKDSPDSVSAPPKSGDTGSTTPSSAGSTPPPTKVEGPPNLDKGDTTPSNAGGGDADVPKTSEPPKLNDTTTPSSGGSRSLGSGDPKGESTKAPDREAGGDPVDLVTGEMFLSQTDLGLPGVLPVVLERFHSSGYRKGRWFGHSWASTFDQRVEIDANGIHYAAPDGVVLHYPTPTQAGQSVLPVAGARWPLFWGDPADPEDDTIRIAQPEAGIVRYFPPSPGTPGVRPLGLISDRNGNRLDFAYDEDGVPAEAVHSGGYRIMVEKASTEVGARIGRIRLAGAGRWTNVTVASFRYDSLGRLVAVVDAAERALVFEYDDEDRIIGWTDRNGHVYRYYFDDTGRVTHTDGTGGFLATRFAYDPQARTTTMTDSLGNVSTYHYNERNEMVRIVDPLGGVTTTELDGDGQLSAQTDPLGRTLRVTQRERAGLLHIDTPEGASFDLEHDEGWGLPTRVTDRTGASWERTYDERGNLIAERDPAGGVNRYEYGERGDLVAMTDASGQTVRFRNNRAGLPVAVTDHTGATTLIERDLFGRTVAITDALGAVIRSGWTVDGRQAWQVLPDGARQEWRYDGEGNVVEERNPNGGVTRYEYGPFDEIVASTDASGARYSFDYDTELRLRRVTNPQGLHWHYEYDARGDLVSETDFNGATVRYRYDAAGQLTERTNAAGQSTVYVRDRLGRVVERRSGDAVYRFSFDAAGRLVSAHGPDSSVEYSYDPLSRVLAEIVDGRKTTYTYDAAGRLVTRTTPSGAVSRWTYDPLGRPVTLAAAGGAMSFQWDVLGRETGRRIGPGLLLSQAFDSVGRLAEQTLWARDRSKSGQPADNSHPALQRTYGYRADGYPMWISDQAEGTRRYDLDPLGRVTAVRAAGWTETYAYDASGNLAHAAAPGHEDARGGREYTGTLIRRAGRTSYEHDACGRVVRAHGRTLSGRALTWSWTWDAEDRLTRVTTPEGTTWQYSYDAFGRRTAKRRLAQDGSVAEVIRFSWDGARLAEQERVTSSGEGEVRTWDWEPDTYRVLAQTTRTRQSGLSQDWVDTAFHAIVTNLIGTPTELVAPDGRITWRAAGSLWGGAVAPGGEADFPLRFPGQYHDAETGLNYNFQRYYDPALGVYLTPDPLGLNPAPNNHAYVDNPLAWFDPLGLAPKCFQGTVDAIMRKKRIWGRKINGKKTPNEVYRVDNRPPGQILEEGFAPRKPDGNITVHEHVNNTLASDGVTPAKNHTQFVSTGEFDMFKDGVIANSSANPNSRLYKIDTSKVPGKFIDVNDAFDRAGMTHKYRPQKEWAYEGTIPPEAITGVVKTSDVITHPGFKPNYTNPKATELPNPSELNWQTLKEGHANKI